VKEQIVDMAMQASGIRDTARVLHVSTNTVMTELKKMWSYVRSKAHPRWLWHAIDHHTGTVLV